MEIINIAGVSCRVDLLATLTYEQLFESAKNHPKWKGVKDYPKLIDKELRDNGFKPASKNRGSSKANKRIDDSKTDSGRASKKRSGNSRTGKKQMVKR